MRRHKPLLAGIDTCLTCLSGLTFVTSGTLSYMSKEEAESLIKNHGGSVCMQIWSFSHHHQLCSRITGDISGKTDYLLAGTGSKKLDRAAELGISVIDEVDLISLVLHRTEVPPPPPIEAPSPKPKPITRAPTLKTTPSSLFAASAPVSASAFATKAASAPVSASASATKPSLSSKSSNSSSSASIHGGPQTELWSEQYRPKTVDDLVSAKNLYDRVSDYLKRKRAGATRDHECAVLLSGPPGIGKTTTALIASRAAGFDPIELNASDTRSQKLLTSMLSGFGGETLLATAFAKPSSEVARTPSTFSAPKPSVTKKPTKAKGKQGASAPAVSSAAASTQRLPGKCIIFDEVDGMGGNEDRGGLRVLTQFIKKTKVPVICICNELSPKLKTLRSYCIDLRFSR